MANNLENDILSISTATDNIKNIAFNDVWAGEACVAQTELLKGIVSETKTLEGELNTFKAKVAELDEYKQLLETIAQKESELSSMDQYITRYDAYGVTVQEENPNYIALQNEINVLKQQASEKRNELIAYFNNSFSTKGGNLEQLNYIDTLPDNLDYTNVDSIINKFFSMHFSMIPGCEHVTRTGGLYDVYADQGGKEYVLKRLRNAINQGGSNNRQRSVNAVVELFNLTTAKGVKLPYINKGAGSDGSFVTTDCVATGVDCNAFVCWAVDKGVNHGFQWRPCAGPNGLTDVGQNIEFENWSSGKPGDVLSRGVNGPHSAYVLKNIPEKRMFIIAQASGHSSGIVLSEAPYDKLRGEGMLLRNMDAVYSGEDQASRINQYQNKNDPRYSEDNPDLRII